MVGKLSLSLPLPLSLCLSVSTKLISSSNSPCHSLSSALPPPQLCCSVRWGSWCVRTPPGVSPSTNAATKLSTVSPSMRMSLAAMVTSECRWCLLHLSLSMVPVNVFCWA